MTILAALVFDPEFADREPDLLADGEGALLPGVREHDEEFLAAIARGAVGRPANVLADAPADRGERVVARLVAIDIVVCLESIDIDEEQREIAARASCSAPFAIQDLTERAAIVESREPIGARKQRQLAFGAHASPQLHGQQRGERNESPCEYRHERTDHEGPALPRRVNVRFGFGDHDDERQMLEVLEVVEPMHAVDRRLVDETP